MSEDQSTHKDQHLEGGTYEVLQTRLQASSQKLRDQLNLLNDDRKKVFGSIETALSGTERVTTEHNCIPWDMVPIGKQFIFGYNVHIGLKTETTVEDVFSVYRYEDHVFHKESMDLVNNATFYEDFQKLYKYYKNTHFVRFAERGNNLFMVFRIGKDVADIKTFKWEVQGSKLVYKGNRSDHEFEYPAQFDFEWKKCTRENYREGRFSHISIENKVFVETLGGDLTIKIEDNTDSGKGIYSEPVDHKDQTLDDAEVYYSVLGNVILLKIRPYQELPRFFVFNSKLGEAKRIDELKDSCILLPDDHGIIFTNGYYLQTGEFKKFENDLESMMFEKRIAAPNGEDYLYIFYNRLSGTYLLLHYNLIAQKAENPTICHGYSIFENGEMCLFRADEEQKKHHAIQIWQTPYTGADYQADTSHDSYLFKIGNKDIVRAMAECHEILTLIGKEDSYANLYLDLIKQAQDILDSYHWLAKKEVHQVNIPLVEIKDTAELAVEEFEKVIKIKQNTSQKIATVSEMAETLIKNIKKTRAKSINDYVLNLAELRKVRGEVISLKELRYTDFELIEQYERQLKEFNDTTSQKCVSFLLKEEALQPYAEKVEELNQNIEAVAKVIDADKTEENINQVAGELEMLIDIVGNLDIEDATQTTKIIDNISEIYAHFNQLRAALKKKRKELLGVEGKAAFNAQMKLVDQGIINYLDVCDTPEKCDEFLTKLMVQLEELEAKFSEFDEYIEKISVKREDIYNAFENKKLNLVEAKNKRANNLLEAANRIIKAIQSRLSRFTTVKEINGYFAADVMIEKARSIISELEEMGDTVKSEDIRSRLKTAKEDAVRQLKDKSELYVEGANIIKFGKHQFTVNTQSLDLTIVNKGENMYFHLTGTNFFEPIQDEEFTSLRHVWDQQSVSENDEIYKAEYLVYQLYKAMEAKELEHTLDSLFNATEEEIQDLVSQFMSVRFNEGYVKGVHDYDAALLFRALINIVHSADLLRFSSRSRALAAMWWKTIAGTEEKQVLNQQLKGAGLILKVFPESDEFDEIIESIQKSIENFVQDAGIFSKELSEEAAEYLFLEISRGDKFVIDKVADDFLGGFNQYLKEAKAKKMYEESLKGLEGPVLRFHQIKNWVSAYFKLHGTTQWQSYIEETSVLLLTSDYISSQVVHVSLFNELEGLKGDHTILEDSKYKLDFNGFVQKLTHYDKVVKPQFEAFQELKKELTHGYTESLRLNEFKPRVMASFVRNKLIDEVYLPMIGANLAKQIGAAGDQKRTDLMGLLLLISPPGYGKTTLMEYLANRLGIIFMKINGPALGHDVVAIDPAQAPNAGAKEELNKLNLAFEMGDNVMIYLDDIQHCNPEFLQKFISLCDAQRKIEGVYKGKSKTYDFRGKKVCVVMAGNPYTESGDKFRIPDMLTNRADIYNLGDIVGGSDLAFNQSYVENCLTSNTVLAKLAGKSQKDVHAMIKIAETGSREGVDFEVNHSAEEVKEYINVLEKLLKVRDVILKVNQAYILSAGQSDAYRTEPAFKLQGSYRDMNKIAEKIVPVMNEEELQHLIDNHYKSESQTLTSNAEANLLKFKEMIGTMTATEKDRWDEIVTAFMKQQKMAGYGENNQVGLVVDQMAGISKNLNGIREEMLLLNLTQKNKHDE